MLRGFALLLVGAQALAAPRTDAVVQPPDADPPLATLYLRADGSLDPGSRAVIASAAALLARLPGATLTIDVEPRDLNAVNLAEAFASLPTGSARVALLSRLVERNASRWAQRDVVDRAMGLPPRLMLGSSPRRVLFEHREPSDGARAFLARPRGLRSPGRARLEVAGVVDPAPELIAALAEGETLPGARASARRSSAGMSGHRLVLPWRAPRDACGPLELLGHLDADGRLRIELAADVDPAAQPGVQAVARALRRATPHTQVELARLACGHALRTREDAAWLLSAVGIDPTDFLEGPAPPPLPPSTGPLLDGAPTTFLDALSLQKPPSLRRRISMPGDARDPRR